MCSSLFIIEERFPIGNFKLSCLYLSLWRYMYSSVNTSRNDIYPDISHRSSKKKKWLKWLIQHRRFSLRDVGNRCKEFINFYPAKISEGRAYALSSYASCFKPSYTAISKIRVFIDSVFPFLLFLRQRERERSRDPSVTRIPNHAQMSFVNVLLRTRVYLVAYIS